MRLYNSQTKSIDDFKPIDVNSIKMYVCGPTVYGPAHIGNIRPAVVFDQLFRILRHKYGENSVKYARNITDIDDKIITAANQQNIEISQITKMATDAYHSDLDKMNVLAPTFEPRATENITGIRTLIKRLVTSKHAYVRKGEVFFHVPSSTHLPLVSNDELQSGHRVEIDRKKKDPRDFVLWKPAKDGEPWWNSPWGEGRPGWHIECSAMIAAHLGENTIDIHGGGQDLKFPHHEAECAQTHAANGYELANYWVHNGLLTVDGEKMSKSRGNVIYAKDILASYPGEVIRFYFLKTHYRNHMDFTMSGLEESFNTLNRFYRLIERYSNLPINDSFDVPDSLMEFLYSDMNIPGYIAEMHKIADNVETLKDKTESYNQLLSAGKMIGLFNMSIDSWKSFNVDVDTVNKLVYQRTVARLENNWGISDSIRTKLNNMGISIMDTPDGTVWQKM